MNEQQLAAVKQALEALEKSLPRLAPYGEQDWLDSCKAITALQSIISQDAPKSMANNGGKTGWPPGMLQDDSRELSKWLASKPDARKNVREAMEDAIKGGVGIMKDGKRIDPASIYAEPKIGCVNHDCDQCKAAQPSCPECVFGMCHCGAAGGQKQPAPVQDAEGENKAVRFFLMLYGQPGLTVGQMKGHMRMSGFKMWPAWVDTEPDGAHLTKAGAQLWIRHLFALEPTAPQPVPVKTYHDGKPWPVAPKPWVGLTDEDIRPLCKQSWVFYTVKQWAEIIEAKLKEKNHG